MFPLFINYFCDINMYKKYVIRKFLIKKTTNNYIILFVTYTELPFFVMSSSFIISGAPLMKKPLMIQYHNIKFHCVPISGREFAFSFA